MDQHHNSMSQGYLHVNFDAVPQDFDFSGFSSPQYNEDPIPQPATPFYLSSNQYPSSPGPQQGYYQSPYPSGHQQPTYTQQSHLQSPTPVQMTRHLGQARLPLQSRQISANKALYMNATAAQGSLAIFCSTDVPLQPFPALAPQVAPVPQAAPEPEGKENRNDAKSTTGTKAPRSTTATGWPNAPLVPARIVLPTCFGGASSQKLKQVPCVLLYQRLHLTAPSISAG